MNKTRTRTRNSKTDYQKLQIRENYDNVLYFLNLFRDYVLSHTTTEILSKITEFEKMATKKYNELNQENENNNIAKNNA